MSTGYIVVGLLLIAGTIGAAYLSYKIFLYNRLSKGWLAVSFAFALLVFQRILTFSEDFHFFEELSREVLKAWNAIVLILVTVLFIIGLWSMKKNFESFEVVERKTEEKVNSLQKKSKR